MTTLRRPIAIDLLAALTILLLLASRAPATEFFGEPEAGGSVRVFDDSGVEVDVLTGDPFGARPGLCPSGSYYFNELESDKAQLVLTDCSTGDSNYPIQLLN
jgi:hypothetical protein